MKAKHIMDEDKKHEMAKGDIKEDKKEKKHNIKGKRQTSDGYMKK